MNNKFFSIWKLICLPALVLSCKQGDATPAGVAVKTLCVKEQDYTTNLHFTVKIESQQNINIFPVVGGRLQKICVQEGTDVKKGQLLFVIDQAPYTAAVDAAKAQVASARSSLSTAQLNLEGKEQLYAQKMVGEFDLRRARHAHDEAAAQLKNAQAELAKARANLDYTTIHSPADGRVGIIDCRVGDVVSSDMEGPIVTLSGNDHIYTYTSLSEEKVNRLCKEYECSSSSQLLSKLPEVTLHTIWGEELPQKGRIDAISGSTGTTTGALVFRASFYNPTDLFRNGSNGYMTLPSIKHHVFVIPSDAALHIQDKYFVYRVVNGRAVSTEVKVLPPTGDDHYVVTYGLTDGDVIIAEHAGMMSEGLAVTP